MTKTQDTTCTTCGKKEAGRNWLWKVEDNTKDWFHINCMPKKEELDKDYCDDGGHYNMEAAMNNSNL